MKSVCFSVLAVSLVWASDGYAQRNAPPAANLRLDTHDAAPPDITASDMLGTSLMAVPRLGDTRALQLHLPVVLDNKGFGGGFGLTSAPFRAFLWEREWDGRVPESIRWLNSFSLSLAVANVPTFAENMKEGESELRVNHFYTVAATAGLDLINQRDPLRNTHLAACLDEKAGRMASDYSDPSGRKGWGRVAREHIHSCEHGPTQAVSVNGGMTNDFAALWASYEVGFGIHALTAKVGKRFMHRHHENTIDLGLRYTLERAYVTYAADSVLEVWPTSPDHFETSTRVSSGGGLTVGLTRGFNATIGGRVITPFTGGAHEAHMEYRGYLILGWGGYDALGEYFARGLARRLLQ